MKKGGLATHLISSYAQTGRRGVHRFQRLVGMGSGVCGGGKGGGDSDPGPTGDFRASKT